MESLADKGPIVATLAGERWTVMFDGRVSRRPHIDHVRRRVRVPRINDPLRLAAGVLYAVVKVGAGERSMVHMTDPGSIMLRGSIWQLQAVAGVLLRGYAKLDRRAKLIRFDRDAGPSMLARCAAAIGADLAADLNAQADRDAATRSRREARRTQREIAKQAAAAAQQNGGRR